MSCLVKDTYIVSAKRTPIGAYGGNFVKTSIADLQTTAFKAALASANINPDMVDCVVVGNVFSYTSSDGHFCARHAALRSGIPIQKPCFQVNRLCGSGFQSIINAIQEITMGTAKLVLTGGTENMSQSPYMARNIRFGTTLGVSPVLEDSLWLSFTDTYCKLPMALTAEKLGEQYKITREEVDRFSFASQMNYSAAHTDGRFNQEMAPVEITVKGKKVVIEVDEHPRPKTTMEGLAKLTSLFKENGLITAGTASGICDGAGAVIVASEEAIKQYHLKPLARIVAYSVVGVEPSVMGIGPVPAIQNVLTLTGKTLDEIDLVEINEAFAPQTLACAKELKLDLNKLNVDGGAIAMGHPVGMSGSRIMVHLVHELKRRNAKYGIGSACIGGGQGVAIMIESL